MERSVLEELRASSLKPGVPLPSDALMELLNQPRFTYAGLANNADDLSTPRNSLSPFPQQHIDLGVTAKNWCEDGLSVGFELARRHAWSEDLPRLHRFSVAFQDKRAQAAACEEATDQTPRAVGDDDLV